MRAAAPTSVDLAARIDAAGGRVAGVERIVVHVAEGEHELRLWLWADRLAVPPTGMDERTWRTIYPGEIDRGGARIERVDVDGTRTQVAVASPPSARREFAGTVWSLPIDAGPERDVTVVVHFRVDVPQRFGRLGRIGEVLSLAGPWMPLVLGDHDAWDFRVPWSVSIETTDARDVAIADAVGASGRRRPVFARVDDAAYVPVLIASHLSTVERNAGAPCGARIVMQAPPPSATLNDLTDSGRGALDRDAIGRIAAVAGEVCRTLTAAGLAPLVHDVPVLVVPSRVELAATADGMVTVSDRAYRVSHIDALLDFHDRAVRAAIFRALLRPLSRDLDAPGDRPIADDVRAALLADEDEARRHGHAQTPDELIGFAAFHPTVDQLLYAPQVPFPDVYFGYVEEQDPFRDDPRAAFAPLPRGTRLLHDLRAALSPPRYRETLHELHAHAVRDLLTPALAEWLAAPSRPTAFRLGHVRSQRDGAGWAHHVEVLRSGAPTGDPIVVEVEDDHGHRVRGAWTGEGARGDVVVRTAGALSGVRLDPDGYVPQSSTFADAHPRTDDATGQPWRPPLLSGFELSYSQRENRIDGLLDFALHQRFDLDHTLGVRLQSGSTSAGALVRYLQGFGPLRDLNSRVGLFTGGLDVERLRSQFADFTATSAAIVLGAGVDTRVFRNDWRYGVSLGASLRAAATLSDDYFRGKPNGNVSAAVSASVRGTATFPLGLRNAVMFVAGGGLVLGAPHPAELQQLGGLYLLRGFAASELLGHGRIYAVAELRSTVLADLSWSIFDLVYVREIQLAFFGGAGGLFQQANLTGQPGADARFVADVGAGVRIHYLYGGVQPGVMVIDFATPIAGTEDGYADLVNGHIRIAAYVSFDQYF